MLREQLAFQRGEEALGHGLVVAVTDRAHRTADADRLTALAEEQRGVLAAVVGVMDHPLARTAVPDRHLERAHDQLGAQVISHRPTDHPATEDVEDDGQIEKALPLGRDVRDVRNPEVVRRVDGECALDQIWGWLGLRIALRRLEGAPTMASHQTVPAHEAGNALVPAPSA